MGLSCSPNNSFKNNKIEVYLMMPHAKQYVCNSENDGCTFNTHNNLLHYKQKSTLKKKKYYSLIVT